MYCRRVISFSLVMGALFMTSPALGDFWGKDAPDWGTNAYYTNQIWTFADKVLWDDTGRVEPAIQPDNGYVNPNHPPGLYRTGYTVSVFGGWDWLDEGPMHFKWDGLQGMLGGMGKGYFDFFVPIADVQGTTSVWVQYVSYLPNKCDGSAMGALIGFDREFTKSRASDSKTYEKVLELVDQGSSGDWWRITEIWAIKNAGETLYLRINADAPGTSNMVDSVHVKTKTTLKLK